MDRKANFLQGFDVRRDGTEIVLVLEYITSKESDFRASTNGPQGAPSPALQEIQILVSPSQLPVILQKLRDCANE